MYSYRPDSWCETLVPAVRLLVKTNRLFCCRLSNYVMTAVTQKALTCFPRRHFISPRWGKPLSLSLWSKTRACILSPLHAVCCILPPIVTPSQRGAPLSGCGHENLPLGGAVLLRLEFKRSKFLTRRAASLNFEWISNHLIKWYKHSFLLQLVQVIKHSRATPQRAVEHTVKHHG